jgi:uncharacterized protein YraI
LGAVAAPRTKVPTKAERRPAGKARWIATLSVAVATVAGVGTASAVFVDYLADRAVARAGDAPPPVATKPLVAKALETEAAVKVAALAPEAEQDSGPAVPPPEAEVVPTLPDPKLVKQVAVGPEHAIELPGDDPTDSPILQLDGVAPPDDAFFVDVTVPNDEPIAADAEDDGSADETRTAAIAPDAAEEPVAEEPAAEEPVAEEPAAEEEPVKKPKRKKAEAPRQKPAAKNTEVAALPGVDVGSSRLVDDFDTKPARPAKNLGGVPAGPARVTAAVKLRTGPSKGNGVAGVVPAGSAVNVLSCNGWCEVVHNGKKGWVYKNFLAPAKTQKQSAATPRRQVAAKPQSRTAAKPQTTAKPQAAAKPQMQDAAATEAVPPGRRIQSSRL